MSEVKNKHLAARCVMLAAGLAIMAFGVAFSIKASLGTSPISSVPYATACVSGLSVGTTTIIMNCIFVAMQMLILRRRYQWFQLLQIPAAVVFGTMIDLGTLALAPLLAGGYALQWLLCAAGILLVALGGQRGGGGRAGHHRRRRGGAGHLPGAAGALWHHESDF